MFCKDKTSFLWSRLLKLCDNNNKESSLNSSFLLFIYFLIKCTALKVSFTWSMNNGWRMMISSWFCFMTDKWMNKQTDICNCRVAFATEKSSWGKIEGGPIFAVSPYLTLPSILGCNVLAVVMTIFSKKNFFMDIFLL